MTIKRTCLWALPALLILTATPVSATYRRPVGISRATVAAGGQEGARNDQPFSCLNSNRGPWGIGPPSFSHDGRFVAFATDQSGLARGDEAPRSDVYVRDLKKGKVNVVSIPEKLLIPQAYYPPLTADGGSCVSAYPSISSDGRFVAFETQLKLVEEDLNGIKDIYVRDRRRNTTELVSVTDTGQPIASAGRFVGGSYKPSISGNGRFVAYFSAGLKILDQAVAKPSIYVYDRKMRTTSLGSLFTDGTQPEATGGRPSLSYNGRYLLFNAAGDNFAEADGVYANGLTVTWVRDLKGERTVRASQSSQGEYDELGGNINAESDRTLSANGRFAIFASIQSQFVPNDKNSCLACLEAALGPHYNQMDVFVRDLRAHRTERVSVSSTGNEQMATSGFGGPSVSPDGRYVLFDSASGRLTSEEDDGDAPCSITSFGVDVSPDPEQVERARRGPCDYDTFVFDREMGAVERLSLSAGGSEATPEDCHLSRYDNAETCFSITGGIADGGTIGFWSNDPQLVPRDGNETYDIFIVDRGATVGVRSMKESKSISMLGAEDFDDSGLVVSRDIEHDVTEPSADNANIISARLAYRPELSDLYLKIDVEDMSSTPGTGMSSFVGNPHPIYGANLEIGGRNYQVRVVGLAAGLAKFGLFDCTDTCMEIVQLQGGFGTVGDNIVVSVPTNTVGLADGGSIDNLAAFTATGNYLLGPQAVLDQIHLGSSAKEAPRNKTHADVGDALMKGEMR